MRFQFAEPDLSPLFYKTGQVCRLVGVSAQTLRRWERYFPETLHPSITKRRHGTYGHRTYTRADVRAAIQIRDTLRDLGYGQNSLRIAQDRLSRRKAS